MTTTEPAAPAGGGMTQDQPGDPEDETAGEAG